MAMFAAALGALASWVALRAALAVRFPSSPKDTRARSQRGQTGGGALAPQAGSAHGVPGGTARDRRADGSPAEAHSAVAGGKPNLRRVLARLSSFAATFVPASHTTTDRLRLRLSQAGVPVPASVYYGASVTAVGCGLVLALAVSSLLPATDPAVRLACCLALAGACACAPWAFLEVRGRARRAEIEASLPATLEMLAVAVEAGFTLERALRSVSTRRHDALARELALADDDISLFGYTREQALERMARRCGSDDLALFASSVAVSSKAGAPIASILKRQAAAARTRRFQKLEAKANKIPTKMVFPLAFLVMPGVFIVAISPAVISIANNVVEVF